MLPERLGRSGQGEAGFGGPSPYFLGEARACWGVRAAPPIVRSLIKQGAACTTGQTGRTREGIPFFPWGN